jgi:hypothetical protein
MEPWGGRYTIPGDGVVRILIEAPACPVVEWEIAEDIGTFIVHDPPGAAATVYFGENELRAELSSVAARRGLSVSTMELLT